MILSFTPSAFIVGEKTINELSSDDYSDDEDYHPNLDSNDGNYQLKINLLPVILHHVITNKN